MKTFRNAFAVLVLVLMTACAALQAPKNFEETLAYAYGTHTAVLNAAASAVEVGTLPVSDAEQVLKLADESRVLLDAARVAHGAGDIGTAEGQLALATSILTQLQTYLRSRK